MANQQGWRGYISSREIGGQIIPQRVQNLVIRNYAQKKDLVFLLSATEYYMDNCYMMLNSLKDQLSELKGLIFYSLDLLPHQLSQRQLLYQSILSHQGELHFALEELVINHQENIELIEDIILCRQLSHKTNNLIKSIIQDS
ncbi:LIC12192 family sporadic carbohydrate cluster protein (plasmid) [Crocosphaera watsonii WH 8501]|uniref:Uncharacterized protein n=2 Tax=Crocosphaera watsonii TaxID=263511 RepID=Q4BV46_CROWT|nr:LIC12192 family sporadic carbohydrate cluster protein [Crocosphaera watsonii]EAM47776.1 hypothetical protein CwatDRAFT_0230 [Crocosphaera watsonii WH 8501]CCQ51343.1 hypothetical protein CWATWH8502_1368 [Crocosphaera watsonii WH 8502]